MKYLALIPAAAIILLCIWHGTTFTIGQKPGFYLSVHLKPLKRFFVKKKYLPAWSGQPRYIISADCAADNSSDSSAQVLIFHQDFLKDLHKSRIWHMRKRLTVMNKIQELISQKKLTVLERPLSIHEIERQLDECRKYEKEIEEYISFNDHAHNRLNNLIPQNS